MKLKLDKTLKAYKEIPVTPDPLPVFTCEAIETMTALCMWITEDFHFCRNN